MAGSQQIQVSKSTQAASLGAFLFCNGDIAFE